MNRIQPTFRAFCAMLGLCMTLSLTANAQTTFYTSSAAFNTAISAEVQFTEDYESQVLDSLIASGDTVNTITYDSFPMGTNGRIDNIYNKFDNQSLALERGGDFTSFFFSGESVTVTFSTPVHAVGVFFNANLTATPDFFINSTVGTATTGGTYDQGTFYFAGITSSTAFNTVTIGSVNVGSAVFNLDNLTIATTFSAVPEPGTVGLLVGAGVVGVCIVARRRK